jgi:hypothetical protein
MIEYTSTFFQKVPKYLLEKRSQIIMVLFVSIFAVAFINIFQPFGSDTWIDNNKITTTTYFLWSTLLVSIGMIVVAISRVIMYNFSRKPSHNITILKYIGWVFIELLLLSGAFTLLALIVKGNLNVTTDYSMELYVNAIKNSIYTLSGNLAYDFLEATGSTLSLIGNLHSPAACFTILGIHTEKVTGKYGSLIST